MKKLITLMLSLLLAVTVLPISAASPQSSDLPPLEIRPMRMPTDLNLPDVTVSVQQPGAASGSDSTFDNGWWGLNTVMSNPPEGTVRFSTSTSKIPFADTLLKADSSSVEFDRVTDVYDYARKGVTFNAIADTPNYCPLNGADGIMLYVKMSSQSKQLAVYFITANSGSWKLHMKTGMDYYLLKKGASAWETYKGNDNELIDFPSAGFEGYLYIPKATLSSGDSTDWSTDSIKRIQIQFGRYGGEEGAAYFSLPMAVMGNPLTSSTDALRVEDEEKEYKFFNDLSSAVSIRPVTLPAEIATPGKRISVLAPGAANGTESYYEGAWWSLAGIPGNYPSGQVEFKTAVSPCPLFDTALRLDSTYVEYDRATGSVDNARKGVGVCAIFPETNRASLKNGTGIMLYVKMSAYSKQLAAYFIPEKSGSWSFRTKTGLKYYTLAKGSNGWKEAKGKSNEIIDLPYCGFEGYIYIPKETLSSGDTTDWSTDRIYRMQLQFGRYGGEEGEAYFTPPMVTLDNPLESGKALNANIEGTEYKTELFNYSRYIPGDTDLNDELNVKDLIVLKKILSGQKPDNYSADVNSDQDIGGLDLAALKKMLLNREGGLSVETVKQFEGLNKYGDSKLWYNPDRGFRGSTNIYLSEMAKLSEAEMVKYAEDIIKPRIGQNEDNPGDTTLVMQNYIYLMGYSKTPIDEKGLKAIEIFFRTQMAMGIKGQPRFCYIFDTDKMAEEDATQEMTLKHIDQISAVIPKIKHCIQAFPICFEGAWGEWHSSYYPKDTTKIAEAVMEKLVVPNDLYALIRLPKYKNQLKGRSYYDRIGIENDSIFGKIPAYVPNVGTGGLDEGTEQWAQLLKEAAYTPQEGELYWNSWLIQNGYTVDGYKTLEQLSEHRFTTLSIHHSYLDMEDKRESEIGKWKSNPITADWLEGKKIIYDPDWFRDKNGNAVKRNLFEFIRDHLGYRISAQSLKTELNADLTEIKVNMSLINYGFSAAFNLESGFVILDSENNPISSVKVGEPEKWYSRDPENYSNSSSPVYELNATLKMPEGKGNYKLAFYLKNSAGQYATLANNIKTADGYNILHEFTF